MTVVLEEITFNHDTESDTCDAINLRKNETEFVTRPEWRRETSKLPEHSLAAYSIKQIGKNAITIKARFTRDDLTVPSVEIQAINISPEASPLSSKEDEQEMTSTVLPSLPRRSNVLGWVPPQSISFLEDGDTLILQDSTIAQIGVGVHVIHWQWQFRLNSQDSWQDLEKSTHQIYTVLSRPKEPWCQIPYKSDNTRLPWTDVMDYACHWASGDKDPDIAAGHVTYSVRDLEKVFYIIYDPSAFYSEDKHFDCSAFLQLMKDGIGKGSRLNCTDCASAVSTFANILGCALWQSTMDGGSTSSTFLTNSIRLFGRTCWQKVRFGMHEVAWKGACQESNALFDAAVELDGDDCPTLPPRRPLLPRNLVFGEGRDRKYVFRFLARNYNGIVRPQPTTRKRRSVQAIPSSQPKLLAPELQKRLDSTYKPDAWPTAATSVMANREIIAENFVDRTTLLDWEILVGPHFAECADGALTLQLLLTAQTDQLIRLDLDLCISFEQAQEYMRHRLALFVTPMEHREEPGEMAFVEPEVGATLFLRSNLVALSRDAGSAIVDVTEFARRLDRLFCEWLGQDTP